jgi:hypothetical protein
MAKLKPRNKYEWYLYATADFILLDRQQSEYAELLKHPMLCSNDYWKEVEKIMLQCKRNPTPGGQRKEARKLEAFLSANNYYKQLQNVSIEQINQSFVHVYEYFEDMFKDNKVGYLEDDKFEEYLASYEYSINKNKNNNLNCWDKGTGRLIQVIAEFKKNKTL